MIVVTGVPRSGSMSVSSALSILGYNTLFYCPLSKHGNDWVKLDNLENCDVIIDWSIAGVMELFLEAVEVDKVIFLIRENTWMASLEEFKVDHLSNDYIKDLDGGIKATVRNKTPFIILDVVNKPSWKDLCGFLDKPIPDEKFPHLNKSEFNYRV